MRILLLIVITLTLASCESLKDQTSYCYPHKTVSVKGIKRVSF